MLPRKSVSLLIAATLLTLSAFPACAQVEARSVALANNCKPTKIDVTGQTNGRSGQIFYLVTCENKTPAPQNSSATAANTMRITCSGKLCVARN